MKVSVVMPAYNAEKYIVEAIQSVLQQDFEDFKLIIVNDGSTDKTREIINGCTSNKIITYDLPVNCGNAVARNIGIKLSGDCEYIAVMDADDICHKNRLKRQASFLDENRDIHILGSNIQIFNEELSSPVKTIAHPTEDSSIKPRLLLLNGTAMSHPSSMMRVSFIADNHKLYPPPLRGHLGIDHEFWISCIPNGVKFHALKDVLLFKRRHKDNISADSSKTGPLAERKTEIRSRLLSIFYPGLNRIELLALATLLEEGKQPSFDELSSGYIAAKMAAQDKKSHFGEDKSMILNFFQNAINKHLTKLKS